MSEPRTLVDALVAAFEKHPRDEWGEGPLSDFIEDYLGTVDSLADAWQRAVEAEAVWLMTHPEATTKEAHSRLVDVLARLGRESRP